jgi:hypothetical protein
MSLERNCPCGNIADDHSTCFDCDAERFDERDESAPTRAALGERLSNGGLAVPKGFES